MLVPETATNLITALLKLAHDEGGHQGADRTFARLHEARVAWRGMSKAVQEHCASCPRCQHAKTPMNPVPAGLMAGAPIPSVPFDTLVIDYVGPLIRSTSGHLYILVIMDMFTRWVELIPTKTAGSDSVEAALERIFIRYGIPRAIQSDQGSHFTSGTMAAMAVTYGFEHHFTSPRHPQSNGMLERQNKPLVTTLKAYTDHRMSEHWSDFLARTQWDLNTATNASMGMSPFTALFGFHPRTRVAAAVGMPKAVRTLAEHHAAMETLRESARKGILVARATNKERYDRSRREVSYEPGDWVLVFNDHTREHKLHSRWDGPCRVTAKRSDLTYLVYDPIMEKYSTQHVSKLRPFDMSRTTAHEQSKRLLPPDFLMVEAILAHRPNGDRLDFLVQYDDGEEPAWQDAATLQRLDAFKAYVAANHLEDAVKAAVRTAAKGAAAKAAKT